MAEEKKDEQAKPASPAPPAEGAPKTAPAEAAPKAAPAKPPVPAPVPWQSDLVNSIHAAFPDVSIEALTYLNQNFLVLPLESILPLAMFLKSDSGFDMLTDLTAVDYPKREKRFEVI